MRYGPSACRKPVGAFLALRREIVRPCAAKSLCGLLAGFLVGVGTGHDMDFKNSIRKIRARAFSEILEELSVRSFL
jgi:hypothetical protein